MRCYNCLVIMVTGMVLVMGIGQTPVRGAIKYVDDGQGRYSSYGSSVYWYNGTTDQIALDNYSLSSGADLQDLDSVTYALSGKCLFTSPLYDDSASHDTLAIGDFLGENVTFTFHGKLMKGTDYILGSATTTADIFKGTFDLSQGDTWRMQEVNTTSNKYQGSVDFIIDKTVGLGLGASIPNTTDVLKAGNFTVSFTMQNCNPVDDFSGVSIYSGMAFSPVQFEFTPEPLSLMLFGVGSLLMFGRGKQSR